MTEAEIRQMLVESIAASTVRGLHHSGLTAGFLAGTEVVPFELLSLDSMGEMEICIAVEVNTGIEVVPGELQALGSLGGLVAFIKEHMA
jgi:hypothetical protein